MSKFKFRRVGGLKYRSWKLWSEGDYIVGKYVRTKEDQFGNPSYEVEVIESQFANEDDFAEGDVVGINSCGGLNYKMEGVLPGSILQITYEGEDTMDKGKFKGKSFHSVDLQVDDSSAIDVAEIKETQNEIEEDL